jgi:hypothetical protein
MIYLFVAKNHYTANALNTRIYENIANKIATTHIGITVLCLYPTPNGRYAPFG